MAWQRKLGAFLVGTGALLVCLYLVPAVYGAAMSRLAVAQFRAQSPANREWDSSRIRAYQRVLAVHFAAPEAVLSIPKVGLEVPVLEGVDDLTMNRGAGHVPGTARPGEPGNVAIAGHRDGFFRVLKDVAPGDLIQLQRPTLPAGGPQAEGQTGRQTDRYVVRSIRIVSPSDTSALRPATDNLLTLITCYPFHYVGAAPQRYIVQASLVPDPTAHNNSGD